MGKCPRQESLPTLYTKILTVIAVEAPLLLDLGYASPPAAARLSSETVTMKTSYSTITEVTMTNSDKFGQANYLQEPSC